MRPKRSAAARRASVREWITNANGTITNAQSGLCMDATGRGTSNGTKVIIWTCNGQTNQQWTMH